MSDYRDDSVETAVISDKVWGGFRWLEVQDYGSLNDALLVTIGVLHAEVAGIADEVIDRPISMVVESGTLDDQPFGSKHLADQLVESAAAGDRVIHRIRAVLEESGHIEDMTTVSAIKLITDSAFIEDETTGKLRAGVLITETAGASDQLVRHAVDVVIEAATLSTNTTGRLRASVMVQEVGAVDDQVITSSSATSYVVEMATVADEVSGVLHASVLVEEVAQGDAELVDDELIGQAWISEAANWAMSRYAPFGFRAAAVIDGVVYLAGHDGLYALDAADEAISAEIVTGKIDTGARLGRPVNAYGEYELDGTAEIEVTQTQDGQQAQSWAYPFSRTQAEVLTNGRVTFGKGLRGRHFSFALRLSGKRAYFNDLTVLTESGSRRV